LLGTAPIFIPAPDWLRDKTLGRIQLTSAGAAIDADTVSHDTSALAATTQRLPLPDVGQPPDIDGPTERFGPDSGDTGQGEKRDRSRLRLLLLLLIGLPLVAVGLTIVILRLPDAAVAPIGDTEKAPAATVGDPAGTTATAATPSDAERARTPQNVAPAVTPQAPQLNSPAPPALAPSQPGLSITKSQQAQRPTTQQPRTFTPAPPSQQRAPAQVRPEPAQVDPEPAELPPPAQAPAQQAPAPQPQEPPVPLQDQARIQERHSPPVDDATTTVPYPR
jgi:hypothetical protein